MSTTNIQQPLFKRIDDPWIALIVLAVFILISTIIAIIILCLLWRRHKRLTQFYNESYILNTKSTQPLPSPIQDYYPTNSRPKNYETQSVELYVPQNERDLGEIHARFNTREGIQSVHHLRPTAD